MSSIFVRCFWKTKDVFLLRKKEDVFRQNITLIVVIPVQIMQHNLETLVTATLVVAVSENAKINLLFLTNYCNLKIEVWCEFLSNSLERGGLRDFQLVCVDKQPASTVVCISMSPFSAQSIRYFIKNIGNWHHSSSVCQCQDSLYQYTACSICLILKLSFMQSYAIVTMLL